MSASMMHSRTVSCPCAGFAKSIMFRDHGGDVQQIIEEVKYQQDLVANDSSRIGFRTLEPWRKEGDTFVLATSTRKLSSIMQHVFFKLTNQQNQLIDIKGDVA